jgi:hypothetical protein
MATDDPLDYPEGHPLRGVPDEVLAAARTVLDAAAVWNDVDPTLAHAIADSVVSALQPWLNLPPESGHAYLSTYCYHGRCEQCRLTCKTCGTPCIHPCHQGKRHGEA